MWTLLAGPTKFEIACLQYSGADELPPVGPIHIGRSVKITEELAEWFIASGFERWRLRTLHVTLAYSNRPVDWRNSAFAPKQEALTLRCAERRFEVFGAQQLVLTLKSATLEERWNELKKAGASWDFETFVPHITVGHPDDMTGPFVQPYGGNIELNGEYRTSTRSSGIRTRYPLKM